MTRGGGSLEDLWAFNEEVLIRAVAASRIPTFAAIGHSVDLSLTELAADGKAITPTAAAETIFPELSLVLKELENLSKSMGTVLKRIITDRENQLNSLKEKLNKFPSKLEDKISLVEEIRKALFRAAGNALKGRSISLSGLIEKLRILSPKRDLVVKSEELVSLRKSLLDIGHRLLDPYQKELSHTIARLDLVSPLGILGRGYALATTMDGKVIRESSSLSPGDRFLLLLGKGKVTASVETVENSEEETDNS
jgi:exodeoxyribonuclease VII large subunit